MVSSVASPEDVINIALARIGFKSRIGSIWDGSVSAKKALDIYSETRDEILRSGDWGFAERNATLTLLKSAPIGGYVPPVVWSSQYPAIPWLFSYQYPSDCLKVRSVKPQPILIPNFDPQPNLFSVDNDNSYSPALKVVLCNLNPVIMVYTGQITNPLDWEADFIETFTLALGHRLAPALTGMDAAKMQEQDEMIVRQTADRQRG